MGVEMKLEKHYFTPIEEDRDFCARCGFYFLNEVHFRTHEEAQKQEPANEK
jgi:hypothetical protein